MRWIPGTTISDLEKMAINDAMRFYEGRKTDVAHALGISIKTLYNKLEEYAREDEIRVKREADEERKRQNWLREQRGEKPIPFDEYLSGVGEDLDEYAVGLPKKAETPTPEVIAETKAAVGGRRGR